MVAADASSNSVVVGGAVVVVASVEEQAAVIRVNVTASDSTCLILMVPLRPDRHVTVPVEIRLWPMVAGWKIDVTGRIRQPPRL
jgi:hypothetical protein